MQYHDDATTPYTSRALLYPGVEETARVGSFASHPANPRDCWFAFAVPQQWYQVAIEECISGLYHTRVGYPTAQQVSLSFGLVSLLAALEMTQVKFIIMDEFSHHRGNGLWPNDKRL